VNINGRPALRVDDMGIHAACCGPNTWNAAQGSATVVVNGKPLVRMQDMTRHCGGSGKLIEGSDNVIVGGAPSSVGNSATSSGSSSGGSGADSGSGGATSTASSTTAATRSQHATERKHSEPVKLPAITITASAAPSAVAVERAKNHEADHHATLSADNLTPCATDEETEFKKKVYKKHCENASRRRKRSDGVPESELAPVENGHKMRKEAAAACNRLFAEMRAELARQKAAGDPHALKVNSITLTSGYRDPGYDQKLWDQYYAKYYRETAAHRETLGKHRKAQPGVGRLPGAVHWALQGGTRLFEPHRRQRLRCDDDRRRRALRRRSQAEPRVGEHMVTSMAQEECRPLRVSPSGHRGVALGLSLIVVALGSASASAQAPSQPNPVGVAFDWLATLRSDDASKLGDLSRTPFVQRGFDRCNGKKAATPGELTVLLGCIAHSDQIFVGSIPAEPAKALSYWRVLKPSEVARANRKAATSLAKTHVLVGGAIDGDGVSYDVAIAVAKDGRVGGILLNANLSE
jgi:hypothetical protein